MLPIFRTRLALALIAAVVVALERTLTLCGLAAAQSAPAATPATAPTTAAPTIVYQSKYDDPQNLALWSQPQTDKSAGRIFLGRFYNVTESLTLKALPEHAFVRLRAQLCIMDSWDGNLPGDGPDELAIRLGDGRSLMQSTFTIYGPNDYRFTNQQQSFPDDYGTGDYPGLTGAEAAEVKWLPRSNQTWGGNAVYTVEFTFPHTAADLRLDFQSALVDSQPTIDNESWGLGNVEVALLAEAPTKLTLDQVRALLADLRADDPLPANTALRTLIAAGDPAVDLIRQCLDAGKTVSPEHVADLIRQLDDDKYIIREVAQKELEAGGRDILNQCDQALHANPPPPPEADSRLRQIIAQLQSHTINKLDQRLWRVLGIIGTEKALALRSGLNASAPPPDLETIRHALGVEAGPQWQMLSVKISQVVTLLSNPSCAAALRDSTTRINASPAMQELRKLVQQQTPDATLKQSVQAVRAQRTQSDPTLDPDLQQSLNDARRDLQKAVTARQEAALVALNILD